MKARKRSATVLIVIYENQDTSEQILNDMGKMFYTKPL